MAPVYEELSITWAGETYTVKPNYALIQRVEQTISIASLFNRAVSGNPPLSQLADLLAVVLRTAGCKDKTATAENINAELYDASSSEREQLTIGASAILRALLPTRAPRGNVEAPAEGAPKETTTEDESKTSTGGNTTKLPSDTAGSSHPSSGR